MLPSHKVFESSKYVERESEKKLILDAITTRPHGVFIFEGDRGVGKTSLLFSLFLLLDSMPGVKPFVLSLFPFDAPELRGKENACLGQTVFGEDDLNCLLEMVTTYWGITDIPNVSDDVRREYFARGLAGLDGGTIPVLMIDSIYECDDNVRQALEEYLISPLVSSNKGFTILTGRGRSPIWSRPELRHEPIQLNNFEQQQTEELLRRIGSNHLDKLALIYKLSDGYPLMARLLGAADMEPEDYLSTAIDILLEETLPIGIPQAVYAEIRIHLEKLSVIRSVFRNMEVENYLFNHLPVISERRSQTSVLVNTLLGSHIMKYKGGGFVINNSISVPLREFLNLPRNTVKYQSYRTLLAINYDELAGKYPDAAKYYQQLKTDLFTP